MSKQKYTHLHKYKKIKRGTQIIFKCMLPGCRHYIEFALVENALCACNRCDEPMILTRAKMVLTRPHCDNCVKKKDTTKEANVEKLAELFSDNS